MSFDWLIRMAGHFEGFSDEQMNQIEKAMPATKALIDISIQLKPTLEKLLPLYQKAAPVIQEGMPIVKQAMPLINQAMPHIEKAVQEWGKIAPAVSIVLNKLNERKTVSRSDVSDSWPWT